MLLEARHFKVVVSYFWRDARRKHDQQARRGKKLRLSSRKSSERQGRWQSSRIIDLEYRGNTAVNHNYSAKLGLLNRNECRLVDIRHPSAIGIKVDAEYRCTRGGLDNFWKHDWGVICFRSKFGPICWKPTKERREAKERLFNKHFFKPLHRVGPCRNFGRSNCSRPFKARYPSYYKWF